MKIDLRATVYNPEKKSEAKRLRKQGKIPAVLYGHGEKSKTIYVEQKDFKQVLNVLKKEAVTVNLTVENKNYPCVIKSIQHNPGNEQLLHIDFQHIHKKEKIRATIPIHHSGEALGIKKGGILDVHLYEVVVRCLPDDMPSRMDIDVSQLDLGQTIHLKELKLPNVDFELTLETSVISVLIPKKVEEVAKRAVAEEVVAVEGEEGKEGVEAKEGEKGKEPEKVKEEKETKKGKEPPKK